MKKRWTAILLALLLTAILLPATAQAAQTDSSAGARLTGVNRTIYDILREEAAKIASGERSSTSIRIPDQDRLSWSLQELGLSGGRGENALNKLGNYFDQNVNMNRILLALTMDCPYEMYWADNQFTWGYSTVQQGDQASIKNLVVYIHAAQAYRDQGSVSTVSAEKVAAAQKASEAAKAIVAQYADLSDYEKLNAYREEICRLVSYDTSIYQTVPPYGDTWQLVYVFDGDPETNVVCEGYAKAFKYLCDLSEFDGDVTCWIATGKMDGGDHMWNVVRMGDGNYYLADVTNCDTGTVGADGLLFLSGASPDGSDTYIVAKDHLHCVYTYSDTQRDLFCDGFLPISGSDYVDVPGAPASTDPVQSDPPASSPPPASDPLPFSDVAADAWYAQSVAWAVEREITDGTSDTTFSPAMPCTHGQILTFLWRAAGKPDSASPAPAGVDEEDFFYDAVRWAAGEGMLSGQFNPRAGCSRADAVRYIWQAFQSPDAEASTVFTDVPADAPFAQAVSWAVDKEVTTGTSDTTFDPNAICSRGHIVTFLYRAYH